MERGVDMEGRGVRSFKEEGDEVLCPMETVTEPVQWAGKEHSRQSVSQKGRF